MVHETLTRLLTRTAEFEAALLLEFPNGEVVLATQEPRYDLAAAAALIAIEHAGALRASVRLQAINSAAGLLRLQYEAVLRSAWLIFGASPVQVDNLARPLDLDAEQGAKSVPGHLDMLAAVGRAAPSALAAPLAEFNQYSRHALNSFVHAGIHPLTRARTGFPLELADTLLRFSAGMLHFAYRLLAALSGSQELMNSVTRIYSAFADCLPMAPKSKQHELA